MFVIHNGKPLFELSMHSWLILIYISVWQNKLDRISEQLEPDEVEEDYFR